VAEALPFEDGYFEASMGTFTVHQWPDLDAVGFWSREGATSFLLWLSVFCSPTHVSFTLKNNDSCGPDVASNVASLGCACMATSVRSIHDFGDGSRYFSFSAGTPCFL
jgi:hypothetical protein